MSYTRKMTLERKIALRVFDEAFRQRIKLKRLAEMTDIVPMRMYHLNGLTGLMKIDELYRLSKALGVPMERFVAEALADGES